MTTPRKKLIEVSIPLEAINKASAHEKMPGIGPHPRGVHLWWARRPLAACRAVLFAQLVDDPSAWPDRFPTEAEQEKERLRLHKVIADMVPWEMSNNEVILNAARWEIARSVAWGLGEEPPPRGDGKAILAYLQEKAPPVYDPFSGGGSIPLEAQRLGLRAYGSDLNPVAVLIGKALVEIPPKFAGLPPMNPTSQAEIRRGGSWNGRGAQGLAEDVRYYGQWMREEAEKRIGHLYPKAKLPDGSEATVIAWLWARTVRSPDPAAKGAMVPLVSNFMLSTKQSKKTWVEPVIDPASPEGWHFEVNTGPLTKDKERRLAEGTKSARATFRCILSGATIGGSYIDDEAQAGRMSSRLMAIVAEGNRARVYLSPLIEHERMAGRAAAHISEHGDNMDLPQQECRGTFASNAQGRRYCFRTFADYFTSRQLVALSTFSDLVDEVRERVLADAHAMRMADPSSKSDAPTAIRLHAAGSGAMAYADAVATYLALGLGRVSDFGNSCTRWSPSNEKVMNLFARQAISMTWDYTEANVLGDVVGGLTPAIDFTAACLETTPAMGLGQIDNIDAAQNSFLTEPVVISTDPPYYDNIGYADLSDFFYVWLRRSLSGIWPNLFRRLSVPKMEELVATPYRHGGSAEAENFFMRGMGDALTAMRRASSDAEPAAVYYAFKQAELADEGVTSAGWATFLQAVRDGGFAVDGTWPVRSEQSERLIGKGANALASSIVLICRKRPDTATTVDRAGFTAALRRELPDAIAKIRAAGVGPVDMQQSVIGPGMGVFTRFAEVLEDDDSSMPVKTALAVINRVWEEIDSELVAAFDSETQVALAWFGSYGFDARSSGELITLSNAKNTAINRLFESGVFTDLRGKAALTARDVLPKGWSPANDRTPTVWECVQHTVRVLNADDGGLAAAARLVGEMGRRATDARALIDRLFRIATEKGWSAEALVYNQLAEEWPHLLERAGDADEGAVVPAQAELQL